VGLNIFKIKFEEISKDAFLRHDVDYFDINSNFLQKRSFKKLKNFTKLLETGHAITKDDYAENITNFAHVVVRNIKGGEYIEDDMIYLNEDKGEELAKYKIENGDIVIAISSNVGASFGKSRKVGKARKGFDSKFQSPPSRFAMGSGE